ncbi:MAG TPA: sugar-binding protein [Polyangia bacterium]
MGRLAAALPLVFWAACNFNLAGLPIDGDGSDLAASADLAVAADAAMAPDLLDPCGPPVALPTSIVPVQCVIGTPPTVDGDLSDWGALANTVTHENAQFQSMPGAWMDDPTEDDANSSAQFALRWDLTNLYVAVHVTDDVRGDHAGAPGYEPYNDDAIELYLDGLHDRTMMYGADDHQFIVTGDGTAQEYKNGGAIGAIPVGDFAFKADAKGAGFAVEFRVPWSALGGVPATSGRVIGLDLLIDDDDNPKMQVLARFLTWWNMTSAGCTYPAGCTGTFGAAELVGR